MRQRGVDEKAHLGIEHVKFEFVLIERRDFDICEVNTRDMILIVVEDGHLRGLSEMGSIFPAMSCSRLAR